MKINEIKEEGKVSLLCLITKADKAKTQKNTPYLSLTLQDKTGFLDAKFWNLTDEMVNRYKPGQIVKATGDIILHKNAIQLRVRHLEEMENENILDYVMEAPIPKEEMKALIEETILGMNNPILQNLTDAVYEKYKADFYLYPAAVRNHHNFAGGLAYHTISMLKAAQAILPLYPFLDADLLNAGIILHDLGKVKEYTGAILPEYSIAGNLVGHISLAAGWVETEAERLGVQESEEAILLKHMILSHHGKLEYGSPVLPMIPEAELLNLIDNMDARMYRMHDTLNITEPGTFSPRVFALDNRMLYRRKEKEEE